MEVERLQIGLCLDICLALTAHVWLRNNEPDSLGRLFLSLVIIPSPIVALSYLSIGTSLRVWQIYVIFVAALLASIVIYRSSPFHSLARYPGPWLCKITKIWVAYIAYGGKTHEYYKELHAQYGPIVRIGPNELSINDSYYVPHVLGKDGMPKGPLWRGRRITPAKNRNTDNYLVGCQDLQRHAVLRKPWNRAFSSGPLKDYEEIMINRATQLIDHLEHACEKSDYSPKAVVDIAKWISFFTFDFMGDMVLGAGFELMRDGDEDGLLKNMEAALVIPSIVHHIPWISRAVAGIPWIGKGARKFGAFAISHAQRRFSSEVQKKDLFYHLLDAMNMDESKEDVSAIIMPNVVTAVIAGADTTASVLSNVIYYLICNVDYFKRLRDELDEAFDFRAQVPVDIAKLSSMKVLNAVINETLRLQPAVPSAIQRAPLKGSGGRLIGNIFIKEGTAITMSAYALHRSPRNFSPYTEYFWPDRWLIENDDKVILNVGAFIPFSYGPANCAGKSMAMLELRYMTAILVRQFDFSFAPEFSSDKWEKSLKDRAGMAKGPLPVMITLRSRA